MGLLNTNLPKPRVIVVSKRAGSKSCPEGYTEILIDRTTVFGNPREHLQLEREASIEAHMVYLRKAYKSRGRLYKAVNKLVTRMLKGEKLALVCWCYPKTCHGDNLQKALLALYEERKKR